MSALHVLRGATAVLTYAVPGFLAAADWTWKLPANVEVSQAKVEICPYLYGKEWAYALEIDDGPKLVINVAQPLLAKQQFTDAPPGVSGGKPMPFVGGVAIMVLRVGGNGTLLSWDDLRKLNELGWGVISHSYFHKGRTWGNPPEILSAEQIRHDLFWSQWIIASELGEAPTHFVYPNGYTDYAQYLGEFGMYSGTRVGGSSVRFPYAPEAKHLDTTRNYLDGGVWTESGKGEPMWSFPKEPGPAAGEFIIDFTHGIGDPGTDSYARWEQRLGNIGQMYGAAGKDNVWCAPSGEIFNYVNARMKARVSLADGQLSVSLSDEIPGSPLTIKLTGISGDLGEVPAGTTVYRQGDVAWVTTPTIGKRGARIPGPAVKRIYAGKVESVSLPEPAKIAAVRIKQFGKPADGYELKLSAVTPDGNSVSLVDDSEKKLPALWGNWHLFGPVPLRDGLPARSIEIHPDRSLTDMEIWVVDEKQ